MKCCIVFPPNLHNLLYATRDRQEEKEGKGIRFLACTKGKERCFL